MSAVDPLDPSVRQRRLALLARARLTQLRACWQGLDGAPGVTRLRGPEIGLAMIRGRMDARGDRFNLGEVTMTRASVRLDDDTIGHGYVLGRSLEHAEWVATYDALAQQARFAQVIEATLLAPTEHAVEAARAQRRRRAGATRCSFDALVREASG
ncbi:MAG: phosphonate C-P lyase system protein PhnG [Halofilum sp. (in: g-proteobacteria)]